MHRWPLPGALAACALLAAALPAQGLPRDWLRRSYRVSAFELEYALPHPGEPPTGELLAHEFAFSLRALRVEGLTREQLEGATGVGNRGVVL